ncbi:sigma factor-like helix-turn-helix DNA-binding protein [Kocuria turfanensis]|uniref:sigma factor-like helix-turn-helix DNA-binding protein n=1 Tax=Kocuria turfanensis TaxID=388357 RepID=UPI004035B7A5
MNPQKQQQDPTGEGVSAQQLTEDQAAAVTAWSQAQDKAEQGRRLVDEAASESRAAVTALSGLGMTQKQIAALLGITQGRVSQLIVRTPRKD